MNSMNRRDREQFEEAKLRKELHDFVDRLNGRDLYEMKSIIRNFQDVKSFFHLVERLGRKW